MSVNLGIRVVRGPDWKGKDEDGDEGHVGTVCKIRGGRVTVIWDSGRESTYMAGENGKCELLIFDNAPAGVTQDGFKCNACSESPITGMLWKCAECTNVVVCTRCYMTEKHEPTHSFLRKLTPTSSFIGVPPRFECRHLLSYGIFETAMVIPGPHWEYGTEDGGNVGSVETFHRSGVVDVQWFFSEAPAKQYRAGKEGKLDIIYVQESQGWKYLQNHLPVLDVEAKMIQVKVGDKVSVNVNLETFKEIQNEAEDAEWSEEMTEYIREVGTVTESDDVHDWAMVQYQDSKSWRIVKSVLTVLHSFSVGDVVQIIDDVDVVKLLQISHGGWTATMSQFVGKQGKVVSIDKDNDLLVKFSNPEAQYTFSPVVCTITDLKATTTLSATSASTSFVNSENTHSESLQLSDLCESFYRLLTADSRDFQTRFIKAASCSDLETLGELAEQADVNGTFEGVAAIHMASMRGNFEVVAYLFDLRVDIDLCDNSNFTPLHYAAFGNHDNIVKLLLENQAEKNAKTNMMWTPMHIAVERKSVNCLKVLIEAGCDPNIQDNRGNTPLHYAITSGDSDVIDCFRACSQVNLHIFNNKDANPFHVACSEMCAETRFVTFLMKHHPDIVNSPTKEENLFPLHIAAVNGFYDLATTLINVGKADVNSISNENQTPLHMAVMSRSLKIVELLIAKGADINAQDKDGNTPLHIAQSNERTNISTIGANSAANDETYEIKACLVEHGADIDIKNNQGRSPLDLVEHPETKAMFKRIAKNVKQTRNQPYDELLPSYWDTMENNKLNLILLSSDSEEFKMVVKNIKLSLTNMEIVSIKRIQNVDLWRQFVVRKQAMENSYGPGLSNEMLLFHGTTEQAVQNIVKQNIDFRLAGKRAGTLFGRGAYFAVDAKKSDSYTKPNQKGHKFMFFVKVLLGLYKKGASSMVRPPPLDESNGTVLTDSTVDNENCPSEIVIYSETQIYPEYLIEYK